LIPEVLEPADVEATNRKAATEFNITMHGESYHIKITGTGYPKQHQRPYYISVDGVPEELMLEALDEVALAHEGEETHHFTGQRPHASKPGHVTTAMPGIIVDVLVKEGDKVQAGDPVLITEAMKMETEVQAPVSGEIKIIHVSKGESVNPDEALIEIE